MFDYNKNAFASAGWTACSREQFDQIISDPLVAMVADELANLAMTCDAGRMDDTIYQARKASLKRRLPAFAFHAHFPDGRRKNEGAQPSGLCMIDLDHLMAPRTVWNQLHAAMQAHAAQQAAPQSVACANDASNPSANNTRQDSSFLIGSADTAPARQSESELSLPSLTRSVPNSSLKKDPCANIARQDSSFLIGSADTAPARQSPSKLGLPSLTRSVPNSSFKKDPSANNTRQDSSFLIGSADTAPARQSPSKLGLPSLTRSVPNSSLKKDPCRESLCDVGLSPRRGGGGGGLLLSHITPSGRGLRLVFRLPESYRSQPYSDHIAQFQEDITRWIESIIHEEGHSDPHVKDLARISFAVPRSYILHLDERLFEEEAPLHSPRLGGGTQPAEEAPLPQGFAAASPAANNPSNAPCDENTLRVATTNDPAANDAHHSPFTIHHSPKKDPAADPLQGLMGQIGQAVAESASPPIPMAPFNEAAIVEAAKQATPPSFKGVAYADIIDKYWDVMGGPPAEGERNTKLHQLAYHLRYICDFNADLLQQIMPTFGLSHKEMQDLIQSALKAPRYSYSNIMNKVLNALHLDPDSPFTRENCIRGDYRSPLPPDIPPDLPHLIDLLTRYSPKAYQPAVAHGIFPPLATHLSNVRFRYVDNVDHEATLMCLLMAGSSAGKSCLTQPLNYIMADIRARDEINMIREKEWKKQCTSLGSNKDKPPRPEGLIIQEVDPDMTNPAFVMRMKEAEPAPLYACMNEVEQFDNLRSSRGSKAQFQIMCLAFDPGNRYGQTRVSNNAITEKVTVRFNWNASTTINKGQRYFNNVAADGPLSRINVCTILPQAIGDDMPVYGIYPDDYPHQLQPYIDNLCQANGLILIPQAADFARQLIARNAEISSLTQDRVFEHLSFRAAVIAWLKACLLYVAQGRQWDPRIEEFCQWSMDYDLWCKMRFFGQQVEQGLAGEKLNPWRRDNYLNKLKDTFSYDDLTALIRRAGLKSAPSKILHVWTHRGFIRQTAPDQWQKIPRRSVLDELESTCR